MNQWLTVFYFIFFFSHKQGCAGIYWAILANTRLYTVILAHAVFWLYLNILGYTGLYTAIQGFYELFWLYRAKHGYAGIYWAILANTMLYMVILGHAVFWAILGYTRLYLATLGYTYT